MDISSFTQMIPLAPLQSLPSLQSIGSINSAEAVQGTQGAQGIQGTTGFSQYLNNAINQLNSLQVDAENKTNLLLSGNIEDFHTPIIALEKASLGLGMATSLRNRLMEAYQEVMRMQI